MKKYLDGHCLGTRHDKICGGSEHLIDTHGLAIFLEWKTKVAATSTTSRQSV